MSFYIAMFSWKTLGHGIVVDFMFTYFQQMLFQCRFGANAWLPTSYLYFNNQTTDEKKYCLSTALAMVSVRSDHVIRCSPAFGNRVALGVWRQNDLFLPVARHEKVVWRVVVHQFGAHGERQTGWTNSKSRLSEELCTGTCTTLHWNNIGTKSTPRTHGRRLSELWGICCCFIHWYSLEVALSIMKSAI